MYREAYQRGMLTVFFSGGSKPLEIWETKTRDGYIKRFLDPEIKTMVLEIRGSNISTTYMACPKGNQTLGITMPFLVMIVKNLMKYFSFEVTVLDSTGTRRRFRVSNFQSTTQILPLCTVMPIGLAPGWNQIQFNLAEFTRRAYKNQFVEVQRLKINANIRIRRIYFTEKLMSDDELPMEYKLYFPLQQKGTKPVKEREIDKQHIISVAKDDTDKSGTDSTKPVMKSVSAGSIKKSKKSLQTMTAPEEGKEVKGEQTDTIVEETPGEDRPHGEEATEEDKEHKAAGEEETGTGEEVAGETEEKKSTGEGHAEEAKGDETEEKEHKGDDEDKGAEDKGEGEPKHDEGHDKGEAEEKHVEEKPAEDKPAEEKPAEEKPAEEAETAT